MNIAVIAANGRSGRAFVEEALKRGHSVNAGVHGDNTLAEHPHLHVVTCDATNSEHVDELISGQDAVVSFIGHTKHSPRDVQTRAIQTVIERATARGIRRIISLTGTGVRQQGDIIPFIDRVLNWGITLIDPARVEDGKQHAALLERSALDWTILRVLKLQNTKTSTFELRPHGPTKLYVSREDVARATLDVLENNSFIRQMPILSKPRKK